MIKNSIIVSFRDRLDRLRLFLEALNQSMTEDCEMIFVAQWDEKYPIFNYLSYFIDININYKWLWVEKAGLFCKSMLQNRAVKESTGEYITILDIDCLVPNLFFYEMEYPEDKRLCHNVYMIDRQQSVKMLDKGMPEFNDMVNKKKTYQKCWIGDSRLQGNSQITIKRKFFDEVGGFDEFFEGYGPEDGDLNTRFDKSGIIPVENKIHFLYHIAHNYSKDWRNQKEEDKNRKYYFENAKKQKSSNDRLKTY